ncbi:MAG: carbohydrate ABC transporter permease [Anaerolineae bacterium]
MTTATATAPAVARAHPKDTVFRRALKYKHAYAMIIITVVLLGTFNYYPSFMGLLRAFYNYDVGLKPEFIGFGNFIKLFTVDKTFIKSLGNVAIFTLWRTVSAMVFPFMAAELIFGLTNPRHKFVYRLLMIVPIVVPGMVSILLWQFIYDGMNGLLNALLKSVGLTAWTRMWLADPKVALGAVTLMGFPWIGGTNVLIYLAGLTGITNEIIDSAKMDGCTGFRRIWYIDIPLIRGQFKLLIVLSVLGGLQGWGTIFVMTKGGPGTATMVPGMWLYNNAFQWNKMGYASAIGMFMFVLIMGITIINMKFIKSSND